MTGRRNERQRFYMALWCWGCLDDHQVSAVDSPLLRNWVGASIQGKTHAFRRHELTFLAHRFSGSRRRGILGN
jgi:hypothetical protein